MLISSLLHTILFTSLLLPEILNFLLRTITEMNRQHNTISFENRFSGHSKWFCSFVLPSSYITACGCDLFCSVLVFYIPWQCRHTRVRTHNLLCLCRIDSTSPVSLLFIFRPMHDPYFNKCFYRDAHNDNDDGALLWPYSLTATRGGSSSTCVHAGQSVGEWVSYKNEQWTMTSKASLKGR